MICPKCNTSEMWDNRQSKRNPKQPDYKCKDKDCGHAVWLKPKQETASAKPVERSPKWTWPALSVTYERCLLIARKHTEKLKPTPADVLAATATLFIAATRDGVAEPVRPKPAPVPEATATEPEEELDDLPW